MTVDAVVLGVDAIGEATGLGRFDYHPISKYGQSIEATGSNTTTALVTMVNGFADEWSDAIERAMHGDHRGVTDVSIDTLLLIDGARTGGVLAIDKAEAVAAKLGNVAKTARVVVQSTYASASSVHADVRNIAAAMADGADAFVARLRAGGMQMATAGDGGGAGPKLGGLSAETLAEAAQAAKEAFKDKRLVQGAGERGKDAVVHPDPRSPSTDPARPADPGSHHHADEAAAANVAAAKAGNDAHLAAKSAAGNAETNATKKYTFEAPEKLAVQTKIREAALRAGEKAYKEAIGGGETHSQANTAANKAAKATAEKTAKDEAERSAVNAAARAIDQGGALDMNSVDAKTQNQISHYEAGTAAHTARRLAVELDGLSEREFLDKMAGETCRVKTVNIDGPPPQAMRMYEYPDGTVVRYKPLGDSNRNAPTYSVEVKKDPALPDVGKDSVAFKVDRSGRPLPKGPFEVKNPYPEGSLQADVFEREIMNAGHRALRR
jgi:hypothetical protein